MSEKVYSFRPGSRIKGVDPKKAAEELLRIRAANDAITPDAVVEAARASDSPIHNAFEWDDTIAAAEHRLAQARQLIRAVYVQTEPLRAPTNVFVHVETEKVKRYEAVHIVVQSQSLLDSAIGELRGKFLAAQKALTVLIEIARRENNPDATNRASRAADLLNDAAKELDKPKDEPGTVV